MRLLWNPEAPETAEIGNRESGHRSHLDVAIDLLSRKRFLLFFVDANTPAVREPSARASADARPLLQCLARRPDRPQCPHHARAKHGFAQQTASAASGQCLAIAQRRQRDGFESTTAHQHHERLQARTGGGKRCLAASPLPQQRHPATSVPQSHGLSQSSAQPAATIGPSSHCDGQRHGF